jgi:hypothetical protein
MRRGTARPPTTSCSPAWTPPTSRGRRSGSPLSAYVDVPNVREVSSSSRRPERHHHRHADDRQHLLPPPRRPGTTRSSAATWRRCAATSAPADRARRRAGRDGHRERVVRAAVPGGADHRLPVLRRRRGQDVHRPDRRRRHHLAPGRDHRHRCADFGKVLADERVFGWNKEPRIKDPVIFIDADEADEITKRRQRRRRLERVRRHHHRRTRCSTATATPSGCQQTHHPRSPSTCRSDCPRAATATSASTWARSAATEMYVSLRPTRSERRPPTWDGDPIPDRLDRRHSGDRRPRHQRRHAYLRLITGPGNGRHTSTWPPTAATSCRRGLAAAPVVPQPGVPGRPRHRLPLRRRRVRSRAATASCLAEARSRSGCASRRLRRRQAGPPLGRLQGVGGRVRRRAAQEALRRQPRHDLHGRHQQDGRGARLHVLHGRPRTPDPDSIGVPVFRRRR